MRKIKWFIFTMALVLSSFVWLSSNVGAATAIASTKMEDIFGDTLGQILVYSNGKVELQYKYGLRKADMYYCVRGDDCDNGTYSVINIVDASADMPFKNSDAGLATHTYNIRLDPGFQYRVRIEAYFGTSSAYSGSESIYGSFTVGQVQIADTKENYINGKSASSIGDSNIDGAMSKVQVVVNKVALPIIYIVTSLFLLVKGAVLGFQIVKSADQPETRREKIHALKWLIIGVGITYAATSIVGVVTGFFKTALSL